MNFAVERFSAFREEFKTLIGRHYEEVAQFKDIQELDPDWDAYDKLEKGGKLWAMTARVDGKLVGYVVMVVATHLHYRKLIMAQEDIHYMVPEYRRGLAGYRMLQAADRELAQIGIKLRLFRTKALNNHGKLLERMGGVPHDIIYAMTSR